MNEQACLIISLLLLQCSIHVFSETCPRPEDISPCVCIHIGTANQPDEIDIVCRNTIFRKVQTAFNSLQGKEVRNMNLEKLTIGWMPSIMFHGIKVKNLYIRDCRLKGISDGPNKPPFLGLENSLLKLYIANSIKGGDKLTTVILGHLDKLEELELRQNNIPVLDNTWFQDGPDSLLRITIHACGTRELGNSAFSKLEDLEYLMISYAPFKTFMRSMLPQPAKLKSLYLENNKLFSLPEGAFSGMTTLTHLSLENNSITRLPSNTWLEPWSVLEVLNLSGNPLECDANIEWTFDIARKIPYIFGTCSSPESRKNLRLDYVIGEKIRAQEPENENTTETGTVLWTSIT